jgi:hypothetical protein
MWFGSIDTLLDNGDHAQLLASAEESDVVFMAGEFAGVYDQNYRSSEGESPLPLDAVVRTLTRLPSGVLVVLDRVETSAPMPAQAWFRNHTSPWTVDGSSATLNASSGNDWVLDAMMPAGLSLETGYHASRVDVPGFVWTHSVSVENAAQDGSVHYLFVLRPASTSVTLDAGSEAAGGASVTVTVTEGSEMPTTWTLQVATSLDEGERQSFMGGDYWARVSDGTTDREF